MGGAQPASTVSQPIGLAHAWQRQLDTGAAESRSNLARQLGVSRAHVTQVLRLLRLAPRAREAILALGDPIEGRTVGAHTLRSLTHLSLEEQEQRVHGMIHRNGRIAEPM